MKTDGMRMLSWLSHVFSSLDKSRNFRLTSGQKIFNGSFVRLSSHCSTDDREKIFKSKIWAVLNHSSGVLSGPPESLNIRKSLSIRRPTSLRIKKCSDSVSKGSESDPCVPSFIHYLYVWFLCFSLKRIGFYRLSIMVLTAVWRNHASNHTNSKCPPTDR